MKIRATADTFLTAVVLLLLAALAAVAAIGHAALVEAQAPAEILATVRLRFAAVFVLAALASWALRAATRTAAQRPIHLATRVVEKIATGDLSATVDGMDQVHTRRLMKGLGSMTSVLRVIVAEVLQAARWIAERSSKLAMDNQDLSRRTEAQAAALQQTAGSLEEIAATVAHNAESARKASQLASAAREIAQSGGEVVGQVVTTMGEIAESARQISEITTAIDSIAFQTNILSLNAAVEAARAGHEGRGFAVVASEVRELAHRSAAAARQIKALTRASSGQVERGTDLVGAAGTTMREIVASVSKVSELIGDIAIASGEQSDGLMQVNTAVAHMEQVVQQNSALVERANQTTQELDRQADRLLKLVSKFRLDAAETHPPTAVRGLPLGLAAP